MKGLLCDDLGILFLWEKVVHNDSKQTESILSRILSMQLEVGIVCTSI